MKKRYEEEKKDFMLLVTGSEDNDFPAERAEEDAAERAKRGKHEVVHHKLCYVPMYNQFNELKYLQIKLRSSDYGLGRKVCCAMDISEWVGHEDDDYFTVTLKYLHDHRAGIDYIFTVGKHSEKAVKKLFFKLSCYMRGIIITDETFVSADKLTGYIETKGIERHTAKMLSEMIMSEHMSDLRTYPVLNMMCDDIRARAPEGELAGYREFALYLDKETSLPSILDPKIAEEYSSEAKRNGGISEGKRSRGGKKA